MIKQTITHFGGHDCIQLENEALAVWIMRDAGPRILGLALHGGNNLLAELPDVKIQMPGLAPYTLYGGHRLWHAPENPPCTYYPDDAAVTVTETEYNLLISQPAEDPTGIQKSLAISLHSSEARVSIDHILCNRAAQPVDLAAWAITQLRPGGLALLPQAVGPTDAYGVLPNRHIVLWPYTSMRSPHIVWGDRYLFVHASMAQGALKLGIPNPTGWLGYCLDSTLFVKRAHYQPEESYLDRQSSSQCYCNPHFIELETMGPRARLLPGQSITHHESWQVYADVSLQPDEASAQALVEKLAL